MLSLSLADVGVTTYHKVPSTSKMMPFNLGRSCPLAALGLRGAKLLLVCILLLVLAGWCVAAEVVNLCFANCCRDWTRCVSLLDRGLDQNVNVYDKENVLEKDGGRL